MLNCRACLWRCIQALDAPATNAHRLGRDINPIFLPSQARQFSTDNHNAVRKTEARPGHLTQVERLSREGREPWHKSAVAANQKKWERSALRQRPAGKVYDAPNLDKLGRRDPTVSDTEWNHRKRELRHLQDPLELATFVRQELRKGKATEMLQLVRMASHSMACIVSWNHLIDHYLANEKINDALDVYNEVCMNDISTELRADLVPDEEARTIPRFVHIHYSPARSVDQCTLVGSAE